MFQHGEDKRSMLLGFGFDGESNNKYITRGDNFYLAGGAKGTHELMLDNVMRFNRVLLKYGKKMECLSKEEYYAIIEEIGGNKIQWGYIPSS